MTPCRDFRLEGRERHLCRDVSERVRHGRPHETSGTLHRGAATAKTGKTHFQYFRKKRIFCCLPKVLNTEMAKKVCPRLRELAPQSEAGSRNVGHTFLANAVVFFKNI